MKPLRRVWRVEHSERGHGPWQAPDDDRHRLSVQPGCEWFAYRSNCYGAPIPTGERHPTDMPTAYIDRLRRSAQAWTLQCKRFAYPDAATLLKWWGPTAREIAHRHGYIVRIYAVGWDSHSLYREQIVFSALDAIPLRTVSLLELTEPRQLAA